MPIPEEIKFTLGNLVLMPKAIRLPKSFEEWRKPLMQDEVEFNADVALAEERIVDALERRGAELAKMALKSWPYPVSSGEG